jgi:hypothetical protein
MAKPYPIGTEIPNFGTIQAIKGGNPRDYLLRDEEGTITWIDELAIDEIVEKMRGDNQDG